eukprot:51175-Pleurochrysis_carterae.AAC.1
MHEKAPTPVCTHARTSVHLGACIRTFLRMPLYNRDESKCLHNPTNVNALTQPHTRMHTHITTCNPPHILSDTPKRAHASTLAHQHSRHRTLASTEGRLQHCKHARSRTHAQ